MVWRDGVMGCLPVRLPDATQALCEDHQRWLAERSRGAPVSLAEACRDLLERGIRTCKRFKRGDGTAQLELFAEQERQAGEVRRHG